MQTISRAECREGPPHEGEAIVSTKVSKTVSKDTETGADIVTTTVEEVQTGPPPSGPVSPAGHPQSSEDLARKEAHSGPQSAFDIGGEAEVPQPVPEGAAAKTHGREHVVEASISHSQEGEEKEASEKKTSEKREATTETEKVKTTQRESESERAAAAESKKHKGTEVKHEKAPETKEKKEAHREGAEAASEESEEGNWLEENWPLLVFIAVIVLILLILLFNREQLSRRRRH
ncbi:MAG: hypothetical protein MHM6MM_008148 [Cercozoa sp. M6MM]